MTDIDGFRGSNGVPGRTFEYDDTGLAAGVVAGRYFRLGACSSCSRRTGRSAACRPCDSFGVFVAAAASVADAWTLRLEGLYNDFGETVHQAENRLGVNAGACGPAGLPSPCRYAFDERFALLRLVLVRRLGG